MQQLNLNIDNKLFEYKLYMVISDLKIWNKINNIKRLWGENTTDNTKAFNKFDWLIF